jgi:hypothetical protein
MPHRILTLKPDEAIAAIMKPGLHEQRHIEHHDATGFLTQWLGVNPSEPLLECMPYPWMDNFLEILQCLFVLWLIAKHQFS